MKIAADASTFGLSGHAHAKSFFCARRNCTQVNFLNFGLRFAAVCLNNGNASTQDFFEFRNGGLIHLCF